MADRTKRPTRAGTPRPAPARASIAASDVRRLLDDPAAPPLLRLLGLVTERGGASADSHRKIKQISHFMRLLEPAVTDTLARHEAPVFVDAAAGKGYLGLLLAALPLRAAGRGRVVGIERRDDLVGTVERVATDLTLPFEAVHASTLDAPLPERIHGVFALHACDLATDEAIVRGILAGADTIAVVPCCQAELARLLGDAPRDTAISPLWRGAWHRREFGAHATNVIRALTLEAYGYQVTVTELAGWEHSLKNELILGRRVGRYHLGAWRQRQELLEALGVSPWLVGALDAATPPEAPRGP